MSSLGLVIIVTEIPVCTTILAGIAGAMYRRHQQRADAEHDRQVTREDERDRALATQSQGLAVLVAQVNPLIASVQGLTLRTGSLESTTAALLATMETMQRGRQYAIRPAPRPRAR